MTKKLNGTAVEDAMIDDAPQVVNADLRKFNKAKDQVDKAILALDAIVVTNKQECDGAMETLKTAKKVETMIENKRKELVKPFNDSVKKINDYSKELAGKLPPAIEGAKQKVISWQKTEDERVKKERTTTRINVLLSIGFAPDDNADQWTAFTNEDIIIEKYVIENYDDDNWNIKVSQVVNTINNRTRVQHQQQEQSDELDNVFSGDDAAPVIAEAPPVISAPVVATAAPAEKVKGITKRWTYDVTDESLVPREYMTVDLAKLRAAVNAGTRLIPGVNIYQEDGLMIR
jgi:hypothetical protein